MAAQKLPCTSCGVPRSVASSGPRKGLPVKCHDCRRAAPAALRRSGSCERCGKPMARKAKRFCSLACFGAADAERRRALRLAVTTKSRRVDLDYATAGLGHHARRRLLKRWKQQGRTCAYCPAPATTVDHLIPLVRGGTNYEGNLVPACLSCNSRKSDKLPIEFRLGKRAAYTSMPRQAKVKRVRAVKVEYVILPRNCDVCGEAFTPSHDRTRRCSPACHEAHAIRFAVIQREAYRARVGLPPTWERPVKRRAKSLNL